MKPPPIRNFEVNLIRLFFTALPLSAANFIAVIDSDVVAAIYFLNGFLFSSILCFSVRHKPTMAKATAGAAILGVLNLFVHYSAVPTAYWASGNLAPFFFFSIPSVVGAVITLCVIKYVWGQSFSIHLWLLASAFTFFGSISSVLMTQYFSDSQNLFSHFLATNSGIWIIAFCFALVASRAKKIARLGYTSDA